MSLVVKDLSIRIKDKSIVDQASLTVPPQQFVGVIGPNGCGKSTLLKGVTGALPKEVDELKINELDLTQITAKEIARQMSVVGQFNEVNFDLTVEEMVMLGRTPYKKLLEGDTQKDFDIMIQSLEKMSLLSYRNRRFLSLSGGEKQRVIVARALCQQTPYMILDEPTNHLDVKYQLSLLGQLKNSDIGVLAVLHDIEVAGRYCDYIYGMKDGKVYCEGTPDEVLTSENLSYLYDVPCQVYRNPFDNGLQFYFKENENEKISNGDTSI